MKKLLILFFAFALYSCYPGGAEFVDELDTVYTNYSPEFDFGTSYTYSLPDGVVNVSEQGFFGTPEYIDPALSIAILNELRENLDGMGWQEVDEDDSPDIIVLASAFESDFYYFYDPGYWGGYYPGYGPGWGWYYPGYGPGYVGSYSTGTVLIQMTDPNNIMNDMVPVVWINTINGLLQGSQANIVARLKFGINQAFTQQPFN